MSDVFSNEATGSTFEVIDMDNGAQKYLAGIHAFKRYCSFTHTPENLQSRNELFKLGDVTHRSPVTSIIRVPIDDEVNFLEYMTDFFLVDIPIHFGLEKMKSLKRYVNELTNEVCSNLKPDL